MASSGQSAGLGIADVMPARYGRAVGQALRRRLAAGSVTGISLILGCCAAAWFSAGTRTDDIRGALLLCGGYLTGLAARQLAGTAPSAAGHAPAGRGRLADVFARPARACSAAAEYAVYAGLAAGGAADGWQGTWVLAVTALALVAARHTMSACWAALAVQHVRPAQTGQPGGPAEPGGPGEPDRPGESGGPGEPGGPGESGAPERLAAGPLRLSAGWRVLVIVVAAPVWGPRAALFGLVVWGIIAVGFVVGSRGPDVPAAPYPAPGASGAASRPETGAAYWRVIAACRDDGRFGRYLGRMVRGQLVPLPPALAGLAAAVMLAMLGLRGLPGVILLTPLVVMLLAAPGASHPHNGRFEWLVPALLQTGQYVYLASLGSASGVPAPVTFALCAVTAVWQADLAFARARGTRLDAGLGWEGRMLFAGLGAAVGLAMLAYLALTAYLGVLACAEIWVSSQAIGEDGRA